MRGRDQEIRTCTNEKIDQERNDKFLVFFLNDELVVIICFNDTL